jgi:hypothetical protein
LGGGNKNEKDIRVIRGFNFLSSAFVPEHKGRFYVTKKILKIIMIAIMLLGITLSIINFISVENQARIPEAGSSMEGTIIVNPDGTIDCQGAPSNC